MLHDPFFERVYLKGQGTQTLYVHVICLTACSLERGNVTVVSSTFKNWLRIRFGTFCGSYEASEVIYLDLGGVELPTGILAFPGNPS